MTKVLSRIRQDHYLRTKAATNSIIMSSSLRVVLFALLVLSLLVLQETAAMGNTNIFPHIHKKPNEAKERLNDLAVADEPSGEHHEAFFARGKRSRKAVVDVSRTIKEPLIKVVSKPRLLHAAYDSEEEEMIERLVETQD
jgi:hypothetical protein